MTLEEYILEVKSKRLTRVDLIKYKLEEIPSELFNFDWIEELLLGGFLDYHKYEFVNGGPCKLTSLPERLTQLKKLAVISLCGGWLGSPKCEISDFALLGQIKSLKEIYLNATKVHDVEFLTQLPELKKLQISHTEIVDYSPISNLRSLISITVGDNNLESIDFLGETSNLEAISLTTNNLSSLKPIALNKNLKRICVCNNDSINLNELKVNHLNLEHLCIGGKQTLEIVLPLKQLKEIKLTGMTNQSIEKLRHHTQLKECIFSELNDREVNVSSLVSTEEMELYGSFSEISGLENLVKLKNLLISSDNLESFVIPSQLKNLVISECNLDDLGKIGNLNQLEKFTLSTTKIESLEPLSNATNLKELDIQFNPIKSLKPIVNLIANGLEVDFTHTEVPFEVLELYEEEKFQELVEYYKSN